MLYKKLNGRFKKKTYYFVKILGLLFYTETSSKHRHAKLKKKTNQQYQCVLHPYIMRNRIEQNIKIKISSFQRCYAKILVFFCAHFYPMAYLLSHIRLGLFENATEASLAFRHIMYDKPQHLLCLPRAIFIATTSKRFRKHGAMFIGVFAPSRHMHAWVIEDEMVADKYDNIWILYTPVAVMQ